MVLPQGPEEKLTGSLEFNDVTFTYPGDQEPTLKKCQL